MSGNNAFVNRFDFSEFIDESPANKRVLDATYDNITKRTYNIIYEYKNHLKFKLSEKTRFKDLHFDGYDFMNMVVILEDDFNIQVPRIAIQARTVGSFVDSVCNYNNIEIPTKSSFSNFKTMLQNLKLRMNTKSKK